MDFTRLAEFLEASARQYDRPFFDFVVHKNGKQLYRKQYGFSDEAQSVPVSGNERCYMYSCSKIVTCAAALTLLEQGKYHMDDAVKRYLPEFAHISVKGKIGVECAKKDVTVRNIFAMTSGLDYDLRSEGICAALRKNAHATTAEIVDSLARYPFASQPDEKFIYGLSHDVLARLIEVWSGKKFSEYVKEAIFEPLGMNSSTFCVTEEVKKSLAPKYIYDYEAKKRARHDENDYLFSDAYESGGAGMVSTANDYIKFLDALQEGRILSKYTLRMMRTPQLSFRQLEPEQVWWTRGYLYGCGVKVHVDRATSDNNAPLGIFGWSGAAGSTAIVDPKNRLTILYMQHMHYDEQGDFEPRLLNVLYSCLGDEVTL